MEGIVTRKIYKGSVYFLLYYGNPKRIYMNATKLCNNNGKDIEEWLKSKNKVTMILKNPQKRQSVIDRYIMCCVDPIKDEADGLYIGMNSILDLAMWISTTCYDEIIDFIYSLHSNLLDENRIQEITSRNR